MREGAGCGPSGATPRRPFYLTVSAAFPIRAATGDPRVGAWWEWGVPGCVISRELKRCG